MTSIVVNKELRTQVWRKTNGICWYCGNQTSTNRAIYLDKNGKNIPKIHFTVDHFIPVTKGGKTEIDNLVPACQSCNTTKNNRSLENFRYYLAWKEEAGFYFSKKQIAYLQSIGVELPKPELNYKFYFETMNLEEGESIEQDKQDN